MTMDKAKLKEFMIGLFILALILISAGYGRIDRSEFERDGTGTVPAPLLDSVDTQASNITYNVGYKIYNFQYTYENETENITTAVWYPTQEEAESYTYPYGDKSEIAVNASLDIENGPYPFLLFAHGYTGCGLNTLFFNEYLASQGFIVAAPDFVDTTSPYFVEQIYGCRITGEEPMDTLTILLEASKLTTYWTNYPESMIYHLPKIRLGKASFIIDKMLELNNDSDSSFYNAIDEDAIGMYGHSLGGLTTQGVIGAFPEGGFEDERIKAAIILSAPVPFEDNISQIDIPLMAMFGDDDPSHLFPDVPRSALYDGANPPKYELILKNSTHYTFSDPCKDYNNITDCQESDPHAQVIDNYGTAFFKAYLKGDSDAEEFLNGTTPAIIDTYRKNTTVTLIPTKEEIFEHINTIFEQGIRRPGYPADVWTEDYIYAKFMEYGLEDVRKEEVTHHLMEDGVDEPRINYKWAPVNTYLIVYNENESIEIPAFSVPFSNSTNSTGMDLEIAEFESQTLNEEAEGKIALYPMEFRRIYYDWYTGISEWYYDPLDTLNGSRTHSPFSKERMKPMEYAINSSAAGFIGVLTDTADPDTYEYYVPYDGNVRSIPGVYISENSGHLIDELMQKGPAYAKLVSEVSYEEVVTSNIIGTLEGDSDRWIIISSHHDGPWNSAVEDASGIAMILAQAEYWSKIPEDERPFNMLFLATSGHFLWGTGSWTFIQNHTDFLEEVALEVSLEHIAMEYEGVDGGLVPIGKNQAYWWWCSENETLIEILKSAIETEDIDRSYIFLPEAMGDRPSSDSSFFYEYNVTLVNLVSAPLYLFNPTDTLEKVDNESLVPITRAVIQLINDYGNATTTIPEECELKGDSNCDGTVSDFELLDYIDRWAQGLVEDFDLLEAIDNWAGG